MQVTVRLIAGYRGQAAKLHQEARIAVEHDHRHVRPAQSDAKPQSCGPAHQRNGVDPAMRLAQLIKYQHRRHGGDQHRVRLKNSPCLDQFGHDATKGQRRKMVIHKASTPRQFQVMWRPTKTTAAV
ncbi:hypothetical protein SDC9_142602 [bioreactor metagenome]|uniref:Uncharacterized protein n=1 Tax=bioreactor metagenome TaxID=1076179 RepID=A0A645E231_9ZZZZ